MVGMWVAGSNPVPYSFEQKGQFFSRLSSRLNITLCQCKFAYILSLCPFPNNIVGKNLTFFSREHECEAFNSFLLPFAPIAVVFSIANAIVRRNGPLAAKPYLQLDQLHLDLTKSSTGGLALQLKVKHS
jgi:hypothetical protein